MSSTTSNTSNDNNSMTIQNKSNTTINNNSSTNEINVINKSSSNEIFLTKNDIFLPELLSSCIDACRRGCEVIRNVRTKSLQQHDANNDNDDNDDGAASTTTNNDTNASSLNVKYKIANDPRSALTEADEASQKVIVGILKEAWGREIEMGSLRIVGEEDDDDDNDDENTTEADTDTRSATEAGQDQDDYSVIFDRYNSPRPDVEPVQKFMFSKKRNNDNNDNDNDVIQTNQDKPIAPIIIFIDPMDGTREFVENRIHNVQCLIGITHDNIPLGGAVGMPLVHEDGIEVAFGLIRGDSNTGGGSVNITGGAGEDDGDDDDDGGGGGGGKDNHGGGGNVILSGVKHFRAINPITINTNDDNKNDSKSDGETTATTTTTTTPTPAAAVSDNDNTLVVLSGDSKKPALQMAMKCLETTVLGGDDNEGINNDDNNNNAGRRRRRKYPPHRKIVAGGCGNKMLYVGRRSQLQRQAQQQEQQQDGNGNTTASSITPPTKSSSLATPPPSPSNTIKNKNNTITGAISIAPPGSSSWDTAAPTAVLLAMDPRAKVTDLIGRPLIYDGIHLTNDAGVVVSSGDVAGLVHEDLCGRLARDEEFLKVIGVVGVVGVVVVTGEEEEEEVASLSSTSARQQQ